MEAYNKWWEHYTMERDFTSIDCVARKMFGFEMPPVVNSLTGHDSERRHALTRMTDIMVERVIERRSESGANAALTEVTEALSANTTDFLYNYRRGARRVSRQSRYTWVKGWKNHFRVMVYATQDVCLIEWELAKTLPAFLFHIETVDED
jgi:hypothetical protein